MRARTRAVAFALATLLAALCIPFTNSASAQSDPILAAVHAAEQRLQARVGVFVHDTGSARVWSYREDERFPMASTVKTLVCAALLHQGTEAMDTRVAIRESDLMEYSPVTRKRVGDAVPASELCAITMRTSDNTAVNGVLHVMGGPATVTLFLRSIGDKSTRLDRIEPDLNEATPGDPRDTTTPRAMARTLETLVLGSQLESGAKQQLTQWLLSNEVGGPLLRAGVPNDWKVADRTGAGGYGTRGVAAVMWPPEQAPIIAAIYLTDTEASMEARSAAIASIGAAIASAIAQ